MGFLDFIVLIVLFVLLFTGVYFLWKGLPVETVDFETFYGNLSQGLPENSSQFYPNMRYVDKNIGFSLSPNCSAKKQNDFIEATQIIERKTVLNFFESDTPDITVSCSNISPKPAEKGHFIAGEGGPASIINASRYAIILTGKIALYRPESCDTPQIAVHEILHALGFNHNNNTESIMFPYTNCEQTIDQDIINEINRLYLEPSKADLIIESVSANKTGRYLNFDITVANHGLKSVPGSLLRISVGESTIQTFDIKELDIGARRKINVQNLKIPKNTQTISFSVETSQQEISKQNNVAEIRIA